MILGVRLEMLGEVIDALGEEGDLHVGAARILGVHAECGDVLNVGHILLVFVSREVWEGKCIWQVGIPTFCPAARCAAIAGNYSSCG